jgi:hypothetical protein
MDIVAIALGLLAFVLLLAVIKGAGMRPSSSSSRRYAGWRACSALTW